MHANHGHHHQHDHASGRIGVSFALNFVFTIVEFVGGILTNSVAILSDAVHDLGDTVLLGSSFVLERLSHRGRTSSYTYGLRRLSVLSAILNATVLLAGTIVIITRAVPRLIEPQAVDTMGMLILSVVGVLFNGVAVLVMRGGHGLNQRTVLLHLLEDALGWVVVLIGSIVMLVLGLPIIDPILSLLLSAYVGVRVVLNLRESLSVILQGKPRGLDIDGAMESVNAVPGVRGVHDFHIWTMDEELNIGTVHVITDIDARNELIAMKESIREALRGAGVQHPTIEVEFPEEECELEGC